MKSLICSLCLLYSAACQGAVPGESQMPTQDPVSIKTSTDTTNAYAIWMENTSVTVEYPADRVIPTLETDGEPSEESLSAALEQRAALEKAYGMMVAGLGSTTCNVTGTSTYQLLGRAKAALSLAVLNAYSKQPTSIVVANMLRVGDRVAQCEGSILSFLVGLSIFEDAQAVAIWLAERGLLTNAEALEIARIMKEHMPQPQLVDRALENERSLVIRDYLGAFRKLPGQFYSESETRMLLENEFKYLRSLARDGGRSWAAVWDQHRDGILNQKDRNFLKTSHTVMSGNWSEMGGNWSEVAKSMASLGTPPSPNIVGRWVVWMATPFSEGVVHAQEQTARCRVRTTVFEKGIEIVEKIRARKPISPAISADGVRVSEQDIRVSVGDTVIIFMVRLGQPLNAENKHVTEKPAKESGAANKVTTQ